MNCVKCNDTGDTGQGYLDCVHCEVASERAGRVDEAAQKQDDDSEWRRLAMQFDGHRMQALCHLKAMLSDPQAHAAEASKFLAAGPLSGEEVLAQRIAAIAAQAAPSVPDVRKAFDAFVESGGAVSFDEMQARLGTFFLIFRAGFDAATPSLPATKEKN